MGIPVFSDHHHYLPPSPTTLPTAAGHPRWVYKYYSRYATTTTITTTPLTLVPLLVYYTRQNFTLNAENKI